jgi:hypothetical protein
LSSNYGPIVVGWLLTGGGGNGDDTTVEVEAEAETEEKVVNIENWQTVSLVERLVWKIEDGFFLLDS